MCGIVGRVLNSETIHPRETCDLAEVLQQLRHRGPDMHGQYQHGAVQLGHVRLSILDLSLAGSQPMATPDSRFVICYNGEVYNFRELAHSLGLEGLRSHSDTEVILHAFARLGVAVIRQLNGMFAFAVYDTHAQKIWLVRDRLGVKPLYYRFDDHGLAFASEIKALLSMATSTPYCDLSSMHEWLYYGNTLGERTLYQGIRKLLPGHYLELDIPTFRYQTKAYWSLKQQAELPQITATTDELIVETRRLLEQGVKRHLVSDAPVGVFLSGGIDSSAITAFASKHYARRIATYTAGFDFDKGVNELPKARRVAQFYGTEHHEIIISGFEIADIVETMVHHHDMPFSDAANIPLYLLATKIGNETKVVLQGDGGDELFGGYQRYVTLNYHRFLRPLAKVGQHINALLPHTSHYYRRQRYLHALAADDLPTTMALLLTEEDSQSHPTHLFTPEVRRDIEKQDPFARYRECQRDFANQDIINQMALIDSMVILPDIFLEKVDRSTMAASVEARVPFLDHELVDYCIRIPGCRKMPMGRKKWLLKNALEGIVPHDVLYGKKTGFGVPYGHWLRGALKPLFEDQLRVFQNKQPGVLDSLAIQSMYAEHVSRRRDRAFLLWKVLNFMIWANRFSVRVA
ncbi:MAG TPA: asparagine synthase (glutamine-hydrolyzing) [Nitrospirales bacterium]|nr:asparagine synthase (glutamine-hydrolyzing) [Nitrospirales bacterium]